MDGQEVVSVGMSELAAAGAALLAAPNPVIKAYSDKKEEAVILAKTEIKDCWKAAT